ncbi:MAG: PilZ domain-containing protein [Deltaproteobacteria bacterium]|nr:MAG: PilZ domain-containing protein [Deltaproteobacteria bacterium]
MGESMILGERRRALRVPVRGVAVLYASGGPLHGMIENLSQTGALISVASRRTEEQLDMEIRLAEGSGWVAARVVRVEPHARQWRVAVAFDRVDPPLRDAIEASIASARGAARRRPILVIDENTVRKNNLIIRLSDEGMTPLAPKTPLEAIDLLTRSQLHVGVCLLAPGFGVPSHDLRAVLNDSFPWVSVAEITDDLDATTHQAIKTWKTTPIARIADAMA